MNADAALERWSSKLPEGWRPLRLRFACSIRNSNVDKKTYDDGTPVRLCNYTDVYYNEFVSGEIELMEATATDKEIAAFGLKAGDVLITKDSETPDDIAVPACALEPLHGVVCGYHLTLLRPNERDVYGRFLLRALQATGVRDQFFASANGITRYGLGLDDIRGAVVPLPPLPTQRAIAAFLDRKTAAIDALIEKKETLIALLAEKRAALINRAVTKGLNPDVPMKDSGVHTLGRIPSHWEVLRNKALVREVVELSATGEEELLSVSHLSGVTKRSEKDVTMFMAETNEGYKKVREGDLVINTMWAWMGALGTATEAGIVSPAYGVYRLDQRRMIPRFYDFFYRTPQYITEMTRFSKGVWSSRLRLYPESFLALRVAVPPVAEQRAVLDYIDGEVGRFPELERGLVASVERLREYRQALITAAVTGQIDVSSEVTS